MASELRPEFDQVRARELAPYPGGDRDLVAVDATTAVTQLLVPPAERWCARTASHSCRLPRQDRLKKPDGIMSFPTLRSAWRMALLNRSRFENQTTEPIDAGTESPGVRHSKHERDPTGPSTWPDYRHRQRQVIE